MTHDGDVARSDAAAVAQLLANARLLPGWLAEAHLDDSGYQEEARRIVARIRRGATAVDAIDAVRAAFDSTIPGYGAYIDHDRRLHRRLRRVARQIAAAMARPDDHLSRPFGLARRTPDGR